MTSSSRAVVLAFVIALGLWLAYTLRQSLLLIYISVVFAVVLTPAVDFVQRWRIGRWSPGRGSAILIIVGATLCAIVLFFWLALPPIISDVHDLTKDAPAKLDHWRARIQSLPFGSELRLENVEKYIGSILGGVSGFLAGAFSALATLITALLLTAYFILDGDHVFHWSMSLLPHDTRDRLGPALARAADGMRKWLVGQAMLMLVLGSASAVVFGLLRVRYFYVLAVLAGVANIIPLLGPIITVVLASIVAAFDSWMKLLGVLIFYAVYQQVENAYLTPRIMKAQVEMSSTSILVAIILGGALAGTAGALVAVPSAVLISELLDEYVVKHRAPIEPANV